MKIAVALSGGVDSTAVAYQIKQAGHEVVGFTMRLCPDVSGLPATKSSRRQARPGLAEHGCSQCIAPCACVDGRRAAKELGIRHEIVDFRSKFEELVITPFVHDFLQGVTPNPCALCNREMKFGLLWQAAQELGCTKLATGHYASLGEDEQGPYLMRAFDQSKDQTYFMSLVPRENFRHAWFPLGPRSKTAIQTEMQHQGLEPTHQITSTEICFLRERSYSDFLYERQPEAFQPGLIVDQKGQPLGEHQGLARYTIGQRKGLGVAAAHPLYVIRLEPISNRVVVGPDQALWSDTVTVKQVNWMVPMPFTGTTVQVMIRYRQQPVNAQMTKSDEHSCVVTFDHPVRAVTPGQVAAIYQDGRVIAGGVISG